MFVPQARLIATVGVFVLSSVAGVTGVTGLTACKDTTPVDVCDEALPMEGTLCKREGQECSPDEMGCGLYTGVRCEAGVWVHFEVGTGECTSGTGASGEASGASNETAAMFVPCGDEVPEDDTACEQDGEDCAPGRDACAGYVGAMCSGGKWARYEVEPGDPESCAAVECSEICAAMLAAGCAGGPADDAACGTECEANAAGPCMTQFSDAIACGPQPLTFTCDADDRPVIGGCEAEFELFFACSQ